MTHYPLSSGADDPGLWREDPVHKEWLLRNAKHQLDFFTNSTRSDGGFDVLEWDGSPCARGAQELHTTTRLIHSYALGSAFVDTDSRQIVDAGMAFLWNQHRDTTHGGYVWSVGGAEADTSKLAYGHVFVLLAGASAKKVDHPDADRLIADIASVLDQHFWDDDHGLLREEFSADWQPLSTYRGMNANMHGTEAFLAAFEATQDERFLQRAGRILDFFVGKMAAQNGMRIPEHYNEDWEVDPGYAGNPMFRPAGTTPGHSLEFGRLLLEYWDFAGRPEGAAPALARGLIERALDDAWLPEGGLAYTLDHSGKVSIRDRYWWPVAEGIAAIAALQRVDPRPEDENWYRVLWRFAAQHFVDHDRGGWYPELDAQGTPAESQFLGKPDIYHSLQATLLPLR